MARVTKDADVRREELLDVALDLCMTVGFESMSVEQVTTAAGVAKGTFYHYFVSKQDLLTQLVGRFGDQLFEHLETEMGRVSGDALERLRALVRIASTFKLERLNATMSYLPFLYKEENYTLRHKLFTVWLERLRPLLLGIIDQGCREGLFDVADAGGTTAVLLTIWVDGGNRMWEQAMASPDYADIMTKGSEAIFAAQERILGAPEGSLSVTVDPGVVARTRPLFEQGK
jgi:AcrR family transcriptional regulator